MRIALLLAITIMFGVAGFFIGGYAFNFTHPVSAIPRSPASQTSGLQSVHRQVAVAAEHHMDRHNWLHGGAIVGAGLGFLGTLLISHFRQKRATHDEQSEP